MIYMEGQGPEEREGEGPQDNDFTSDSFCHQEGDREERLPPASLFSLVVSF